MLRTRNRATRTPARATPVPPMNAAWKPSVSAIAWELPVVTASVVVDVATADSAAMPSAPPICWAVSIRA